ncbi:MAG: T9SS type A sorting domain-containing protein [Bacteroidia bacterium]
MKIRFYTLILCALFLIGGVGLVQAQTFKFIKDSVSVTASSGEAEIVGYNQMVNTTSQTQTFRWYRFDEGLENGWESQICDKIQCYLPHVSSAEFVLGAGDTSIMDVHFIPNSVSGESEVRVFLFAVGDSANGQFATYFATGWRVGLNENPQAKFNFYPNPVKEKLTIDFPVKGDHTVEIFNILGNNVGTYQVNNQSTLNISFFDLPKGMYILTYRSAEGKVVTKTLTKE